MSSTRQLRFDNGLSDCKLFSLSTVALEYYFIHPVGFYIRGLIDYLTSLIYLIGTGIVVFLVHAKRRSDEKLADLNSDLERRVGERTVALENAMNELAAKQALASVGLAAASIAHEIANPLQTVFLGAQLLDLHLRKNSQASDETVVRHLTNINTELSRLLTLLGELRDVSRPAKLELSPVDLKATIQSVIESQESLFASRKVKVVDESGDDLPPVRGDVNKLKRVVFNLCKNAVDAMREGGTLTLRAHALTQGYVCFEVQDNGPGIPQGANVFEAFATSKAEGWGLGLPIVYQIVSAHNGRIEYHSTPGVGTTFRIFLPTADKSGDTGHIRSRIENLHNSD